MKKEILKLFNFNTDISGNLKNRIISFFKFNKTKLLKELFKLLFVILLSFFAGISAINFMKYKIFSFNMTLMNKKQVSFKSNLTAKKTSIEFYAPILKHNPLNAEINGPLISYNSKTYFMPLNFNLIGTIKGSINYAFFLNKSTHKELFVPQGSEIKHGYYLGKVNFHNVIVTSFGKNFIVHLVKINAKGSSAQNHNGVNRTNSQPLGILNNTALNSAIKKTGQYSYLIQRSKIKKSDLNGIFTQMHAVPDIINGRVIGFKVLSVVPNGIFSYMGFQPGDIIKSINGTSLSSPQEAVNLLSGLMNENNVNINMTRGNQNLTFNYRIE
ncbi:MAG: PDZ domain-containing protein [bacterium]